MMNRALGAALGLFLAWPAQAGGNGKTVSLKPASTGAKAATVAMPDIPALAAPTIPSLGASAPTMEQLQKLQDVMKRIDYYTPVGAGETIDKELFAADITFLAEALKTWPNQPELQPVINDLKLRRKLTRMQHQETSAMAQAAALLADILNQKEFLDQKHAKRLEEDRAWREKEHEARRVLEEANKRQVSLMREEHISRTQTDFQELSAAILKAAPGRETDLAMDRLLRFLKDLRRVEYYGTLVFLENPAGGSPEYLTDEWTVNLNIKIRQTAKKSWMRSSPAIRLLPYLPEIKMPEPGGLTLATAESGQVSVSEAGAVTLVPDGGLKTSAERAGALRLRRAAVDILRKGAAGLELIVSPDGSINFAFLVLISDLLAVALLADNPSQWERIFALGYIGFSLSLTMIVLILPGIAFAMHRLGDAIQPKADPAEAKTAAATTSESSSPTARPRSQETSQ